MTFVAAGTAIAGTAAAGTAIGTAGTALGAAGTIGKILPMLKNGSGAFMGLLKGGKQAIGARRDQKAADSLQPSLYDPQQQAFLAEINQKRKSINSGSAYAADMGEINQGQAGTNQAIVQAAGGDTAGTIQGLLSAQQGAGRLKNQVLAQGNQEEQFYNTFGNNLLQNMSGRSLQLQLAEQAQKRAQWAQQSQDSYGNLTNAAARMGGGDVNWMDIFQKHGAPNMSGIDVGGPAAGGDQNFQLPQAIPNAAPGFMDALSSMA